MAKIITATPGQKCGGVVETQQKKVENSVETQQKKVENSVETQQKKVENSVETTSSGFGSGTYYYGDMVCPGFEDTTYAELDGYTFCESDVSGPNQMTLSQRNNLKIIAIGTLERENRYLFCGKNVRVLYNGVDQGSDFVIWDRCAGCGSEKIDFSLDALNNINSNACFDGVTTGITWEILDSNGIEFRND
jgi:hypothetical protein